MFDSHTNEAIIFMLVTFIWVCAAAAVVCDFIFYLFCRHRINKLGRHISEVLIMGVAALGVWICAGEISTVIYRISLYLITALCLAAYFYSSYRKKITWIGLEISITLVLLAGLLSTSLFLRLPAGLWVWAILASPVNMLLILALAKNLGIYRMSGNKIPRRPWAEVKTPQQQAPEQEETGQPTPGTEFLEGIWDAD
jgi:hypothetical protein